MAGERRRAPGRPRHAPADPAHRRQLLREMLRVRRFDFLNFVEILSDTSGRRIDEDDYPELATLGSCVRFLSR